MDNPLSPVRSGQRLTEVLTPARLNELARLAQQNASGNNLTLGPGIRSRRGPRGVTLMLTRKPRAAGGTGNHAWKMFTTGLLTLRLVPGSVRGRLASNWGTEITVPANQDEGYLIWLEATLSDGGQEMSSLVYAAGAEVPTVDLVAFEDSEAPGILYKPLGVVYSSATAITRIDQIETESFNLTRKGVEMACGTTTYQMEWTT